MVEVVAMLPVDGRRSPCCYCRRHRQSPPEGLRVSESTYFQENSFVEGEPVLQEHPRRFPSASDIITMEGTAEQQKLPSSNSPALKFQARTSRAIPWLIRPLQRRDSPGLCPCSKSLLLPLSTAYLLASFWEVLHAEAGECWTEREGPAVGADGLGGFCWPQVTAMQGRARVAKMTLPHFVAETPMFMPVGTQGKRPALCGSAGPGCLAGSEGEEGERSQYT